jgi:uncharacterized membrane protein
MNIGAVLVPSFAASAVETVEMVTIVVGVGVARQWRATIAGVIAGIMARSQLEKLPGRTLQFGAGGLLVTFGTFWGLEGLGVHWPAGDLSLAWLYPAYLGASLGFLALIRADLLAAAPAEGT